MYRSNSLEFRLLMRHHTSDRLYRVRHDRLNVKLNSFMCSILAASGKISKDSVEPVLEGINKEMQDILEVYLFGKAQTRSTVRKLSEKEQVDLRNKRNFIKAAATTAVPFSSLADILNKYQALADATAVPVVNGVKEK